MKASLVDTHCHLNHPDFSEDLPDVINRAEQAGVGKIICASYDFETSERAVEIAREFPGVYASVGIHPHDAKTFTSDVESQIKKWATAESKVVSIGESGLDYYRNLSPKDIQQNAFRKHIRLAHELGLPLIVHSRDAQEDVISILKEEGLPEKGVVMHCLPSDMEFARAALEMGCFMGIAGPITFQNAAKLREIVGSLPLDSLFVETDAPYLTPHPHRGKRNEPSYLPFVAQKLAEVHEISFGDAAKAATANAHELFRF